MNMTREMVGGSNWDASWAALAPAPAVKSLSRGLTVAVIVGLSALLWELVLGAVNLLIAL